ncbi:hypothetical protein K2173_000137 [Erythroxylum novogranatense]|uniref:Transmembrane protein n=1 Tax=Erythroxylum novogranatense TaxID=1862640 RepID=A0AAV8SNV6_9ROSI|nr:hypothetical protein K2173_000137 [Erythroxylum novogranatense]
MAASYKISSFIVLVLLAIVMSKASHARLLGAVKPGPNLSLPEEPKNGVGYQNYHLPLVLNLLPKGTKPPSGPSKRSNTVLD